MAWLLMLLACASPIWVECYTHDEALEGVQVDGEVLGAEWCGDVCSPAQWWWVEDGTLYAADVSDSDEDEFCVVWGDAS